jgi:hypothetical protein
VEASYNLAMAMAREIVANFADFLAKMALFNSKVEP